MGGNEGTYVESPAPDHGAQRLSGRDLLHLLLQPDSRRRRRPRRHLLRQHRRHPAGHRRAAAAPCLRELAAATADARTWQQACERSAQALAATTRDIAVRDDLHVEPDGDAASLAGAIRHRRAAIPPHRRRSRLDEDGPWPLAAVLAQAQPATCFRSGDAFRRMFRRGAWDAAAAPGAVVPPSARRGETGRSGFLIAGLNPFRLFDDDYRRLHQTWSPARSPRRSPTPRPMSRSAAAPKRWPKSIAPRPRSSPMSATNSARR